MAAQTVFLRSDFLLPVGRYIELEILENKNNATIYFGIIKDGEPFEYTPNSADSIGAEGRMIIDCKSGFVHTYARAPRPQWDLKMKRKNESVGFCYNHKKGNEEFPDQSRMIFFNNGVCVSKQQSYEPDDHHIMERQFDYRVVVGASAPCKLALDVGGSLYD